MIRVPTDNELTARVSHLKGSEKPLSCMEDRVQPATGNRLRYLRQESLKWLILLEFRASWSANRWENQPKKSCFSCSFGFVQCSKVNRSRVQPFRFRGLKCR